MIRYKKYKSSGIDMIGEIPSHWEIKKIKYKGKTLAGGTPATGNTDYWGGDIPWLNSGKVQNNIIIPSDVDKYITKLGLNESATKMIKPNSVLVALTGATCSNIGYLTFASTANQSVVAIENDSTLDSKFLYHFLLSQREQILIEKTGGAQSGVNEGDIKNLNICFPPISEQILITSFLDKKNKDIEKLISNKRKLIKVLKEERLAIIDEVVTKGLNNKVKLKPSGFDWLTEIPKHWEIKKLRYLGQLQNGVSKGKEYFGDGFPFVGYSDVYYNEMLPKNVSGLARSSMEDQFNYSVIEGDIFFTRTSETIEEIGIASTCLTTIEGATFSGFLIRFRPFNKILVKDYSKYYFRSQIHRKYFVKEMNLVTRASLSQDLLKNLPVLIPPLEEQKQIGDYLQIETTRIDRAISKIEKEIELMVEFHRTLIYEVVTGKIKIA